MKSTDSRPAGMAAVDEPPQDGAVTPAKVLRHFRLVFNSVRAHFLKVQKRAGVSGAQLWALSVIADHTDITVGRLADAMDIHQATASNLVRALIDLKLVESHRSVSDRRSVHLKLTDEGAQVLSKAPAPVAGVLPEALARLDPETLRRLDRDLSALLRELQTDEHAAKIPLGQM